MKKFLSRLLAFGLIFILLGGIVFLVGFAASGWSLEKLSGITLTDTVYTESEEKNLSKLNIDFNNSDVKIVFDENADAISVTYPTKTSRNGKTLTSVSIVETESTLTLKEKRHWIKNLFLWDFSDERMTVVLPAERGISLSVDTDNGDIKAEGKGTLMDMTLSTDNGDVDTTLSEIISQGKLLFETDNGDIRIGKFDTVSLSSDSDNGDITLTDGAASDKIELSTDNGDVKIKGRIAASLLTIETDNGDVETDNGGLIDAERTNIETDNGDIEIKLTGSKSDYTVSLKKDHGDSNITSQTGGSKYLSIDSDLGDIEVYFVN